MVFPASHQCGESGGCRSHRAFHDRGDAADWCRWGTGKCSDAGLPARECGS